MKPYMKTNIKENGKSIFVKNNFCHVHMELYQLSNYPNK